ncbi:von willebrand factor type A domain protein (macronuclear) [Tetrahymena thermophila SB210]|uniref:von willebrand factor type A domain protein n=1 Tax=Tetrahymena thermophila (strain SB210) TaxID=312017 RepID=I7MEC8_TETTS|nr:von willebrand factor type A domain protein [Tetrahymena thermophila SB210]EAR96089.2 von willebrand factor type A domain protein [Tetrahymena thermophila SB210]|eukprot:XP_001016334.2 von willebrand factor type A domain protein [Tetrahymena thermophila SB210]
MISLKKQQKVSLCCYYDSQIVKEVDAKYNFQVRGSIASHELYLRYENTTSKNQTFMLNFGLSEDTYFEHLSVNINEKITNFNVEDKKYENQTVFFKEGSLLQLQGNISVQIGKIDKGKEFVVCFKYNELLLEKEQQYLMTLPFCQAKLFQKVEINGDVYSQNSQDQIIFAEFMDINLNKLVKIQQVNNNHFKVKGELSKINEGYFSQEKAYLKVKYTKNNLSMLSFDQKNSEISPYCALINFIPPQISTQENLLTKTTDQLIKSEFVLIIDRSGSMYGPKMELAKESLIFFLKSLPVGSIYNIISFGSTCEIMFDQSVQFNDQNVQNSIQQIDQFSANLGGTNVSKALEHVYLNLFDQYGLRKKIFIITDGEFTDRNETQELVNAYQNRCDINVLCIGKDSQFQQAIEIANKTGGFTQHVKDHIDIISKVILLLSQSCQDLRNSVQMDSSSDHDECIDCIVPNPKQISFIDRSKTLRFYIFLNKKFEDVKKINFKLTTKFQNDVKFEDNYVIDIKDQAKQEHANIHKLGLYQLIKQIIINQWRKCEDIFEDITHSFKFTQNNIINLLKKEAIKQFLNLIYNLFISQLLIQILNSL